MKPLNLFLVIPFARKLKNQHCVEGKEVTASEAFIEFVKDNIWNEKLKELLQFDMSKR